MVDLRNKLKTASFRNQSLQDILKSCSVAIELISVEPYAGGIHNTKMTLKLNRGDNYPIQERYYERIHFYNRLDLKDVLPSGLLLPIENVSETLDILNVEQQGDFEREDLIFNEFDIEAHPDSLGYIGRVATFPWTIKYRVISTGEIVRIDTGPIVTKESIDPDVDFEGSSDQEASISAWREVITDRDDLYISHNATTVKERAFAGWSGLEKIHTDAAIIEEGAFNNSQALTELVFLPNTRRILGQLLYGATFTKLEFHEGVQALHNQCLGGCNFPGGTLIIPDSVTEYLERKWNNDYTEQTLVPSLGLSGIYGVEKLIIGGGVIKMSPEKWGSTISQLKHLEFRQGITHIEGNWNIQDTCETLIFPQGLVSLGNTDNTLGGFSDFSKLKELTIPKTVQYIGMGCFRNMQALEKLTIERGVGIISDYAFHNFGSYDKPHPLKEFNFWGGTVIGEYAFNNWYLDPSFEIVIPDTVIKISEYAFANHDNTKSLRFAEGCRANVDYYAFGNWFKAESLYIADSVQSIDRSFGGWYCGRELYIGKGIKTLGGMVDVWGDGNLSPDSEFTNWGSQRTDPDDVVILPDNIETVYEAFGGGSKVKTLIVSKGLKSSGRLGSSYTENFFFRGELPPEILGDRGLVGNSNPNTLKVYVSNKDQWLDPALSIEPNCIYNYIVPTLDTASHLP